MKTFAPRALQGADFRQLMADMFATPAMLAKFLQVTERTIYRWLADENAPFAVLAALWHETPTGRHVSAVDVGNEVTVLYGEVRALRTLAATQEAALLAQAITQGARLSRVLSISDTGAANDPLHDVASPSSPGPLPFDPVAHGRYLSNDGGRHHSTENHTQSFA